MIVEDVVQISVSFRGPHQNSRYKVANEAALKAGWESARRFHRKRWNIDDFDAAEREFHRVMDNLTLGLPEERGA